LNVQGFNLLIDSALRHPLAQIVHQQSHTVILRKKESVEITPSRPLMEGSALTLAQKPCAIDGTTINFSAFSWAVRSLGQDARNQASKALVSTNPEIIMGFLLGLCPAGAQVLARWVLDR
jgi:hypothetical protein